jgi:hypothetical protein
MRPGQAERRTYEVSTTAMYPLHTGPAVGAVTNWNARSRRVDLVECVHFTINLVGESKGVSDRDGKISRTN